MNDQDKSGKGQTPPATPVKKSYSTKAKTLPVTIDEVDYEIRRVSADVVNTWNNAIAANQTINPESGMVSFTKGDKNPDAAFLALTMYKADAKEPVGYSFTKALPFDIVEDIAKDAYKLNGIKTRGSKEEEPKKAD